MDSHELKVYRGYANAQEIIVSGHVFRKYPSSMDLYDRTGFRYVRSIIQLFTIKTVDNVRITFDFGALKIHSKTLADGYFRFVIPISTPLPSGWHSFTITLDDQINNRYYKLTRHGELLVPSPGGFTIISDIDDTFLISYSRNMLKKIYVLLTKHVESRQSFENVVKHYQLLSMAGKDADNTGLNTFFYVSSSEWNLYDYINRFLVKQNMPKAVLKLKKIKDSLTDFLRTGSGSHQHKQTKIEHIISFYPKQQFILLGDDSQHDPIIYENICKIFPRNIRAIYIRQTRKHPKPSVTERIGNMATMGISTCYFAHSNEAILHSVADGIISREALVAFDNQIKKSDV
ncbi:App1 family protein [Arundinibacter roseus]|uniref:DUF2183 domain-containing protein n=1 Tax=Arundinibacter roseus TaxID=2070510 RepID=A0A4R4KFV0_9BACT|nr:App1 family protein [Arundinibacter roseus]TDB66877.1 DUF2183 domain-containing protein [Arundinibacter roseus]